MSPQIFAGEVARYARRELAEVEKEEQREALQEAISEIRELLNDLDD